MRKRTYRSAYRRPKTSFRRYRRKIVRRRFTRRVADIAAIKKSSTINITTNTLVANTNSPQAEGSTISDSVSMILPDTYSRTGRKFYACNISNIPLTTATLEPQLSRQAKESIYLKGIRTLFRYTSEGSHRWTHRRIVFQATAPALRNVTNVTTNSGALAQRYNQLYLFNNDEVKYPWFAQNWVTETTSGGVTTLTEHDPTTIAQYMLSHMFRGAAAVSGTYGDFLSYIDAPIDHRYVRVIHDSKYIIDAPDGAGKDVYRKHWIPINKTVLYEADEEHADYTANGYSSALKSGDIYVADFFGTSFGNNTERLRVAPLTTLYWHERLK